MDTWNSIVWSQFGAAIDMLNDALRFCPDELWTARLWDDPSEDDPAYTEYWYIVYHTLTWLDLYLTGTKEGFEPPERFRQYEKRPDSRLPVTPYTKADLQAYLDECRAKCQATIEAMADAAAQRRCKFEWMELSFAELQLYSMRHVQEHGGQLNMFLGQKGISGPDWIPKAGMTN